MHHYENVAVVFHRMSYSTFLSLPENALRAMGMSSHFIRKHREEKRAHKDKRSPKKIKQETFNSTGEGAEVNPRYKSRSQDETSCSCFGPRAKTTSSRHFYPERKHAASTAQYKDNSGDPTNSHRPNTPSFGYYTPAYVP